MLLFCWKCRSWLPVFVIGLACLWTVVQVQPVSAQTSCDDIITGIDSSLTPSRCRQLGFGTACLAVRSVDATPRSGRLVFSAPGHTAELSNISQMATQPQRGSAILLGGTTANPVKILVFGDTSTSPNRTQPGNVLTLRASNGEPTCDRTRSGMLLQTPDGQTGTLVVNGVRIRLGSSVYVVPGADLLFDQDPRIDRRQGSRNRNAPLCSGFDSDCNFGDGQCSRNARLVYGPFCREDTYPYIESGLYRVTFYGQGEVQAGATDYNITRDYEMMGTQRLTLPDSYTFCWEGLQENGTGFETIVQQRSAGAYVDHITVEYLGQNCSLRGANNPSAGKGSGEMGVMSVYNIEGDVDVSMPSGRQASPGSGERIRLYYQGNELVDMDDGPTDAPYIMESELVQWATGEGLPAVDIVEEPRVEPTVQPTVRPPADPVVSVTAEVLYDGSYPYALRTEAQAYDPAVGSRNGDGIDHVYFTIRDEFGTVVYDNDETSPAYCAFGGDSPCQESLSSELFGSGEYEVTATAYSASGREASATATFSIDFGSGGGPTPASSDTTAPEFGPVSHNAPDGFCPGDSLVASVEVNDDVGVEEITFWWRAYSDDVGIPDFQPYSLGGGDGYFEATLSETTDSYVDFYFTAVDAAGNEALSDSSSVYRTVCSTID